VHASVREWQELNRLSILEQLSLNPHLNIVTSKETTLTSSYGHDNSTIERLRQPSLRPCCMSFWSFVIPDSLLKVQARILLKALQCQDFASHMNNLGSGLMQAMHLVP
jgi:hypothetical protein